MALGEDADGLFDIADACPVTGAQGLATFYLDADGDGYTTEDTVEECIQPVSYLIVPSNELDCNECFEQLDRFVETKVTGNNAAELMPMVQDHLDRCPDCREEYEALLLALQANA